MSNVFRVELSGWDLPEELKNEEIFTLFKNIAGSKFSNKCWEKFNELDNPYWSFSDVLIYSEDIDKLPEKLIEYLKFKPVKRLQLSIDKNLNEFSKDDLKQVIEHSYHVNIYEPFTTQVRRVTWLTDACTEELQSELDDGWHILAICPQPNQRRPDYVLGKIKS